VSKWLYSAVFLSVTATALSPVAWADSGAAAASSSSEESAGELVVISATRVPMPQSEVVSSVTVITANEIAAKQS